MKLKFVTNISDSCWEYEYLMDFLFSDYEREVYPLNDDTEPIDNAILIYSCMNGDVDEKNYYYMQKCKNKNYGYYIVHLSNEWAYSHYAEIERMYKENIRSYKVYTTAKHVWRQYWQPLACYDNVTTIPLGWKTGFMRASKDIGYNPVFDACFFGQMKSDRLEMVNVMKTLSGGSYVYEIDGWNDKKSAPIEEQIRLYRTSIISPCPTGNCHPDSFRICEVLESGGIPVVKNYHGFSYHEEVFGKLNPIPRIDSWHELPGLLQKIKNFDEKKLANIIGTWYYNYKTNLKERVDNILRQTNYE